MRDYSVVKIQEALIKFVRDNGFPYAVKKGKIVSVDKKTKECTVDLAEGLTMQQIKFKDTVPIAGNTVHIVCYDPSGLEYHILDQSIDKKESFDVEYTEDYKIKANKLDLSAEKIILNTELIKLGKLKDTLLELIDTLISMKIAVTKPDVPAPVNPGDITKLQQIRTELDSQLLDDS